MDRDFVLIFLVKVGMLHSLARYKRLEDRVFVVKPVTSKKVIGQVGTVINYLN